MYITKFGAYTLPTEQLEMTESQGAGRRYESLVLGGAGGALDVNGVGPDPLVEGSIAKKFIIQAASASALQTAIDDFCGQMMLSYNDWRQGLRLLLATLPDGSQRAAWAKCEEARWTLETFHFDNYWLGPVNVTWRLPWPVWWTYTDLLPLGDHLGTLADTAAAGYTFGQGVSVQTVNTSPKTFTITNSGNARAMDGLLEFDGVITNPTVKNLTNKYQFTYTGSLAAGDRLTLKIAAFDAKKNGARGQWPNITLGTARGQLLPMVLEKGANLFEITSTAPNCTFRYYFADSWM